MFFLNSSYNFPENKWSKLNVNDVTNKEKLVMFRNSKSSSSAVLLIAGKITIVESPHVDRRSCCVSRIASFKQCELKVVRVGRLIIDGWWSIPDFFFF